MLDQVSLTRVVSTKAALDTASFPASATVLRTAADEVLILNAAISEVTVEDEHAIIVEDTGWKAVSLPTNQAERFLRNNSSWELPTERPSFAQGMVADTAAKIWLEADQVLFVVPHVSAHDFLARLTADGVTP